MKKSSIKEGSMKKGIVFGVVSTLGLGIVFALFIAFSGVVNVGATQDPSALQTWFLSTTMESSVSNHAGDVQVPALDGEGVVASGASSFESMCATCHGAPGREPGPLADGLHPTAPDLAKTADHWTAAELFWITKHGIKMTGMPAWAPTHSDEELWPVVKFMTELDDIDAQRYNELLEEAKASGGGHDHGSHRHGGGQGHGDDTTNTDATGHHDEAASNGSDDAGHHAPNGGHKADPGHHEQDGEPVNQPDPNADESGGHDHSGHQH
jgi:mono/diheme cytochrome c family protein